MMEIRDLSSTKNFSYGLYEGKELICFAYGDRGREKLERVRAAFVAAESLKEQIEEIRDAAYVQGMQQ